MTTLALDLIPDFDLSARNTLGLRAKSRFGVLIERAEQIPALLAEAQKRDLPVRILGGGSNVVLVPDFNGITAIIALRGRSVVAEESDGVVLDVAAGEIWHELVEWTVSQGFGGLENLALIPGTVGAAPVQNIGAYGAEVADFLESVLVYDRVEGEERRIAREDCAFAYRDSRFKREPGRYVVLSLRLRLPRPWRANLGFAGLSELGADATPQAVMERVIALRQSKLPDWRKEPNAGSFFHNPIVAAEVAEAVVAEVATAPHYPQADGRIKLSAGWLIEQSGLKGFQLGPVGTSPRHALVVVNTGGGSADDIRALAEHIKATVKGRFGVQLQEEPVFF